MILALHFAMAFFIVFGMLIIPLGIFYHWDWIRNRRFRLIHAGLMLFVTFEAIFAITCPLTILEAKLRQTAAPQSFWADQLNQILYWDLPPSFFLILYILCGFWVIYLWKRVPPHRQSR
jgi:hypothetical protein